MAVKETADDASKVRHFRFCSKRFGAVILMGGLLALQDYSFGIRSMFVRRRVFNDEFMKSNFENVHKMNVGSDAPCPSMGYPDMGSGVYSRQLAYRDWFEFNSK